LIGLTQSFWVALLLAPIVVGVIRAVTEVATLRPNLPAGATVKAMTRVTAPWLTLEQFLDEPVVTHLHCQVGAR
jgi:hypothetical protein